MIYVYPEDRPYIIFSQDFEYETYLSIGPRGNIWNLSIIERIL